MIKRSRRPGRDGRSEASRPWPGRRLPACPGSAPCCPPGAAAQVPEPARAALLDAADRLMKGEWEVLGVTRTDLVQPDWFTDPVTGRRSDPGRYSFRVDHRSPEQTGNIKQVWEISRLQHLTLLATAWYLTREDDYAERVASQLRSWFRENPFLSGVHWTSGIELGIRLISLAWIRRLLDDWPGAAGLFEGRPAGGPADPVAPAVPGHVPEPGLVVQQPRHRRGGRAARGQLRVPWFPESERWRRTSAALLERELVHNTFPSGIGRELAADYQTFVAELGFLAAVEAEASGHPVSTVTWERLTALVDSAAALVDERSQPPRQGDSDEGRGLLLDAPVANRWPAVLRAGRSALRPPRLVAAVAGRSREHPRGRAGVRDPEHPGQACRRRPDRGSPTPG